QFGLEIAGAGIDARLLLNAIEALKKRTDGGVRDIARAIERQVTDGIIDSRGKGARAVRLRTRGDDVEVEIVTRRAAEPAAAS
ncbi:MAG: hypothetical protein C5B56_09185, partial [Proteobacteria bacterium]